MDVKDKILVVDDLEINRRVLESYLSTYYDIFVASSGREALEIIQNVEVDIALLDVNMPNMTGFELAELIRKQDVYSELPIIFVTGAALDQPQVIKGLSIGTVDYLCKPFDLKILLLKVQNFIALSKKTEALKEEVIHRKQSEDKLRESLEREKKLLRQLKLSEKMEAVGRLASGISHDFNNLMTALTGHAELMQKKLPDENSHLHAILTICETGIDLSEKLKVFSRNRSPRKKAFNISKLIRDLEEMCNVTIEANIKQDFVIQDEKLIVNGSSSEIQNALLNLIINARDSIKLNGTITVSCQAKTLDEAFCGKMAAFDVSPGNFVCITISDDGCGMDDDTLQKVFEPFYSTKEERGTGLGLSSVYKTILEHDGCLDIQSMEGYGTQVFLYFKKEDMQSIRPKKSNNNDLNLKNIHAFVIDDVNSTLVSIAASLEEYGATVDCFTDPQRALDEFNVKSSDIDIVIVDQVMPGTSGYFLIQEMQEVKPDLKSIIVTGLCDQTKVEGLRKRGAFVVTKPFHLHAFVSAVSDCLKK